MKLVIVSLIVLLSFAAFAFAQGSDLLGDGAQCSRNECESGFQCINGVCQQEATDRPPVSAMKCSEGFVLEAGVCTKTETTQPVGDSLCVVLNDETIEFAGNTYTSDSGQYGIFYLCSDGNLVKQTKSSPELSIKTIDSNDISPPEAVFVKSPQDYDDEFIEPSPLSVLLSEFSTYGLGAVFPYIYNNGLLLAAANGLNFNNVLYNMGTPRVGRQYTVDDFPDFSHDLMILYNTPSDASVVGWECFNSDEQHERGWIRIFLFGWNRDLLLGYPQRDLTNFDIGKLGVPLTDTEIKIPGYVEYTWWYRTAGMSAKDRPMKKTAVLGDECLLSYELSNGKLDITNQIAVNDFAIKSAVCADNVVYNGVSFDNVPTYAVFDCRDVIPKKSALISWIPGNGGDGYCKRQTIVAPTVDSNGVSTRNEATALAYCTRTTNQPEPNVGGQSQQKDKLVIESCQDSDNTEYSFVSSDGSYFEAGYTTINNNPNTIRHDWCTNYQDSQKARQDMPEHGQYDESRGRFIVERLCKDNKPFVDSPKTCPNGCRQGACI